MIRNKFTEESFRQLYLSRRQASIDESIDDFILLNEKADKAWKDYKDRILELQKQDPTYGKYDIRMVDLKNNK